MKLPSIVGLVALVGGVLWYALSRTKQSASVPLDSGLPPTDDSDGQFAHVFVTPLSIERVAWSLPPAQWNVFCRVENSSSTTRTAEIALAATGEDGEKATGSVTVAIEGQSWKIVAVPIVGELPWTMLGESYEIEVFVDGKRNNTATLSGFMG